jgi:holin-like protein
MALEKFGLACRRGLRRSRFLQIALIVAFWLIGEALVRASVLPIPGGVVGLFIVYGLLASRKLSLFSIRRGANWFLAEMLLFFVPAVMAVLEHHEMLGWLGLKILAVIVLGTIVVMAVTAVTVDVLCLWSATHEPARD